MANFSLKYCKCFAFICSVLILTKSLNTISNIVFDMVNNSIEFVTHVREMDLAEPSEKQRIVIFFGTRNDVIKLAPVIKCLSNSQQFSTITVFTGPNKDNISLFLRLFDIKVDIWFNIALNKGQSFSVVSGKLFIISDRILKNADDIWIVQGDTNFAMVIASVAFHKKVRLAHIGAGYRTFNMYSPFPEEYNRKTISSITTYHFATSEINRNNLLAEGIDNSNIFVIGNTVLDSARYLESKNKTKIPTEIVGRSYEILVFVKLQKQRDIIKMKTLHKSMASVNCERCLFFVTIQSNPNASKSTNLFCEYDSRIVCVSTLSFQEVLWILGHSDVILTDSFGIIEQATWYNVPILFLRDYVEGRKENDYNIFKLVDEINFVPSLTQIISNLHTRNKSNGLPYGNSHPAQKILLILQTIKLPVENLLRQQQSIKNDQSFLKHGNNFRHTKIPSIAVILQVFKRKTLQQQLLAAVKQTLIPRTIAIFQNSNFVNVSGVIKIFRANHPKIEIIHIASSKNFRFHGRFHIAFMLTEDYVSIWDDDVIPRSQWLQFCITYSNLHGHSLVGANGRTFQYVDSKNGYRIVQKEFDGQNDYVGHTWTLPRIYLKYYLSMEPLSFWSGEDMQLSYALQKYGISSRKPHLAGEKSVDELPDRGDRHASFKSDQTPRYLLICTLLKHNFKCLQCRNCADKKIIDRCIEHHKVKAKEIENKSLEIDNRMNNHAWT